MVLVFTVSEEIRYRQLDLQEILKAVLYPVEVIGKPDPLDLALSQLHQVVEDPLLVDVEVIHGRGGDI